jgi:predicted DNA-binding transcriptional regulator YafY
MPLRRADCLFDILRVLRAASRPVTAASLADELEVTVRTVYRDIAALRTDRIVAAAVLDEPFKIPEAVIDAWAAERDGQ